MDRIAYRDGGAALTGLLARPAGKPKAAIAVFPTIMNANQTMRNKAQALAEAGYLALICDFYGSIPITFQEARQLSQIFADSPAAFRDRIRAGLNALTSIDEAEGVPIAAIGFCMGGRAVLELARLGLPLSAAVSFHGLLDTLDNYRAEPGSITARILVCHGDADPLVPRSQVIGFWEEMDAARANWHFHSYSGVPHGFTNPVGPDGAPSPSYDASADRQSWAAMHSLFDEVFGHVRSMECVSW